MGSHKSYENRLCRKVNLYNQAVFISFDIKYNTISF